LYAQNVAQLSERQARLRRLEREIEEGIQRFDEMALLAFEAPASLQRPTSETYPPGTGGGGEGLGAVTPNQAVRGRTAELFVLEACWRRFLDQPTDVREEILDEVVRHRRDDPGDVRWGTNVAWRALADRLRQHRQALIACPAGGNEETKKLARLFKDLIEVANERGPGFDVLDPFGVWGGGDGNIPAPRRVEIKAILPLEESPNGHRVVLTTNEFHQASRDRESYVLRLIYVPRDTRQINQVRWAADIPNPVQALQLDKQLSRGVRGGTLPLLIHAMGKD
jgi:hypothetical protein